MSAAAGAWGDSLSRLRRELEAQAERIAGAAEAARAAAGGRPDALDDLERVREAALALATEAAAVLDAARTRAEAGRTPEDAECARWRHDLRTPVNAIRGYTEMVLEDTEPRAHALRRPLVQILEDTDRLLALVERISASPAGGGAGAGSGVSRLLALATPAASEPPDAGAPAAATILVVDDSASSRELLARRLRRAGHRVRAAESGERALRAVEAADIDIVLLDLLMPGMDGHEVLERLKRDARSRDVAVIMISALDRIEGVARCIEAGAEDYLPKPVDPVLLDARISACLERRRWRRREQVFLERLEAEKSRSENLLLQILPRGVIDRIGRGERLVADSFETATVVFSDIVGFTTYAANADPATVVQALNRLFSEFDALAESLGVEKIKTVGDAYMAAAGVPVPRADHAGAGARMALGMVAATARVRREVDAPFEIRVGLHSGPVIAGVIGTDKPAYDLWGHTVNMASRMESYSLPGRVHVSSECARLLAADFDLDSRGVHPIRGMGEVETFFLLDAKPPARAGPVPRGRRDRGTAVPART